MPRKNKSTKVGVGSITTQTERLFAEGGMMDDGVDTDPVSGNDVPVGSLAEEVRDDVDAKLSPGEFVFPADVVRFIGLERLMKLRDEAKKGLGRMSDIGQTGNAEEAPKSGESFEEEDDGDYSGFEEEIDSIMSETENEERGRQTERAFNTGGFVNPAYYDVAKAPKNPALDIRYFNDTQGKTFYIPFVNGKPMRPLPNGATPTGGPTLGSGGVGNITPANVPTPDKPTTSNIVFDKTVTNTSSVQDASKLTTPGREGTYTGENIQQFGNPNMAYNVGGTGAAGELTNDDLFKSFGNAEMKLGGAALTVLASAAGVPGIVANGVGWAIDKYGRNAVNEYIGKLNQETAAKAGGLDVNTPEGLAGAMSQIDQLPDRGDDSVAASAGSTGTGTSAAGASSDVASSLQGSTYSNEEIANASQRAARDVMTGVNPNDAATNAINTAGSVSLFGTDLTSDPFSIDDNFQLTDTGGLDTSLLDAFQTKKPETTTQTGPDAFPAISATSNFSGDKESTEAVLQPPAPSENYGVSQNFLPADFDWKEYVKQNPDLAQKGMDNEAAAKRHYIEFGYFENRPGGGTPNEYATLANALRSAWGNVTGSVAKDLGIGDAGTDRAEIGGRPLAAVAGDFVNQLAASGIKDYRELPDGKIAWSAEGNGNVTFYKKGDAIIPMWGSSSDAAQIRGALISLVASMVAGPVGAAIAGGIQAHQSGGNFFKGALTSYAGSMVGQVFNTSSVGGIFNTVGSKVAEFTGSDLIGKAVSNALSRATTGALSAAVGGGDIGDAALAGAVTGVVGTGVNQTLADYSPVVRNAVTAAGTALLLGQDPEEAAYKAVASAVVDTGRDFVKSTGFDSSSVQNGFGFFKGERGS